MSEDSIKRFEDVYKSFGPYDEKSKQRLPLTQAPKYWRDIAEWYLLYEPSDKFQSMGPDDQKTWRAKYFDDVLKPQLPEEHTVSPYVLAKVGVPPGQEGPIVTSTVRARLEPLFKPNIYTSLRTGMTESIRSKIPLAAYGLAGGPGNLIPVAKTLEAMYPPSAEEKFYQTQAVPKMLGRLAPDIAMLAAVQAPLEIAGTALAGGTEALAESAILPRLVGMGSMGLASLATTPPQTPPLEALKGTVAGSVFGIGPVVGPVVAGTFEALMPGDESEFNITGNPDVDRAIQTTALGWGMHAAGKVMRGQPFMPKQRGTDPYAELAAFLSEKDWSGPTTGDVVKEAGGRPIDRKKLREVYTGPSVDVMMPGEPKFEAERAADLARFAEGNLKAVSRSLKMAEKASVDNPKILQMYQKLLGEYDSIIRKLNTEISPEVLKTLPEEIDAIVRNAQDLVASTGMNWDFVVKGNAAVVGLTEEGRKAAPPMGRPGVTISQRVLASLRDSPLLVDRDALRAASTEAQGVGRERVAYSAHDEVLAKAAVKPGGPLFGMGLDIPDAADILATLRQRKLLQVAIRTGDTSIKVVPTAAVDEMQRALIEKQEIPDVGVPTEVENLPGQGVRVRILQPYDVDLARLEQRLEGAAKAGDKVEFSKTMQEITALKREAAAREPRRFGLTVEGKRLSNVTQARFLQIWNETIEPRIRESLRGKFPYELVHRELWRLQNGESNPIDLPPSFRDALLDAGLLVSEAKPSVGADTLSKAGQYVQNKGGFTSRTTEEFVPLKPITLKTIWGETVTLQPGETFMLDEVKGKSTYRLSEGIDTIVPKAEVERVKQQGIAWPYAAERLFTALKAHPDITTTMEPWLKAIDRFSYKDLEPYSSKGGESHVIFFEVPFDLCKMLRSEHMDVDKGNRVISEARVRSYEEGGRKVLLVDELQNDIHDNETFQGWKKDPTSIVVYLQEIYKENWKEALDQFPRVEAYLKDYREWMMARILRIAAEQGYDRVAWTPGPVQQERYYGPQYKQPAVSLTVWRAPDSPESSRLDHITVEVPRSDISTDFDRGGRVTSATKISRELAVKNKGPVYVRKQLKTLGVPDQVAEKVMTQLFDEPAPYAEPDPRPELPGVPVHRGFASPLEPIDIRAYNLTYDNYVLSPEIANLGKTYDILLPGAMNKLVKKLGVSISEEPLPTVLRPTGQLLWNLNDPAVHKFVHTIGSWGPEKATAFMQRFRVVTYGTEAGREAAWYLVVEPDTGAPVEYPGQAIDLLDSTQASQMKSALKEIVHQVKGGTTLPAALLTLAPPIARRLTDAFGAPEPFPIHRLFEERTIMDALSHPGINISPELREIFVDGKLKGVAKPFESVGAATNKGNPDASMELTQKGVQRWDQIFTLKSKVKTTLTEDRINASLMELFQWVDHTQDPSLNRLVQERPDLRHAFRVAEKQGWIRENVPPSVLRLADTDTPDVIEKIRQQTLLKEGRELSPTFRRLIRANPEEGRTVRETEQKLENNPLYVGFMMQQKGIHGRWDSASGLITTLGGKYIKPVDLLTYPDAGTKVRGEVVVSIGEGDMAVTRNKAGQYILRPKEDILNTHVTPQGMRWEVMAKKGQRMQFHNLQAILYAKKGLRVDFRTEDGKFLIHDFETGKASVKTQEELMTIVQAPDTGAVDLIPEFPVPLVPESMQPTRGGAPPSEGAIAAVSYGGEMPSWVQWFTRNITRTKDLFEMYQRKFRLPTYTGWRQIEDAMKPIAKLTQESYPQLRRVHKAVLKKPVLHTALFEWLRADGFVKQQEVARHYELTASDLSVARLAERLLENGFGPGWRDLLAYHVPLYIQNDYAHPTAELAPFIEKGLSVQMSNITDFLSSAMHTRMRMRMGPYLEEFRGLKKLMRETVGVPEDILDKASSDVEMYAAAIEGSLSPDNAMTSAWLQKLNEKLGTNLKGSVRSQLTNHLMLLTYSSLMPFRGGMAARTLAQPYTNTLLYVGAKWAAVGTARTFTAEGRALAARLGCYSDTHVPLEQYLPGIEPENAARNIPSRLVQGVVEKVRQGYEKGMIPFKSGEGLSRALAGNMAYSAMEHNARLFLEGRISREQMFRDTGLVYLDETVQTEVMEKLFPAAGSKPGSEQFAHQVDATAFSFAENLVEDSMWIYRVGNSPRIFKSQLGKLLGQFGTWPVNYVQFVRRGLMCGDPVAMMNFMARWALVNTALYEAGKEIFGVDVGPWVLAGPLTYGGGPFAELLGSGMDVLSGGYRTERGLRELKREAVSLIPFAGAARDILRTRTALMEEEYSEGLKRALAFRTPED